MTAASVALRAVPEPPGPNALLASLDLPFAIVVVQHPCPWPALGPCWLDARRLGRSRDGRVTVRVGGRRGITYYAYRVIAQRFYGVPDDAIVGLVAAHLCDNPSCCRPSHITFLTPGENVRRGSAPSIVANRTDTCQRGHVGQWVERPGDPTRRYCRTCAHERDRRRIRRKAS